MIEKIWFFRRPKRASRDEEKKEEKTEENQTAHEPDTAEVATSEEASDSAKPDATESASNVANSESTDANSSVPEPVSDTAEPKSIAEAGSNKEISDLLEEVKITETSAEPEGTDDKSVRDPEEVFLIQ